MKTENKAAMARGDMGKGFKFGAGFAVAALVIGFAVRAVKGNNAVQGLLLGGPARVRAAIMGVRMANDVSKKQGEVLTASVTWDNATVDFQDTVIGWPFRLFMTSGALVGAVSVPVMVTAGPGATVTTNLAGTISGSAVPGPYQVVVVLYAQGSDANGQPDGSYREIARKTAGAVNVQALTGPAVPAGGIGNITLSNQLRNRRGFARRP